MSFFGVLRGVAHEFYYFQKGSYINCASEVRIWVGGVAQWWRMCLTCGGPRTRKQIHDNGKSGFLLQHCKKRLCFRHSRWPFVLSICKCFFEERPTLSMSDCWLPRGGGWHSHPHVMLSYICPHDHGSSHTLNFFFLFCGAADRTYKYPTTELHPIPGPTLWDSVSQGVPHTCWKV